MYYLNSCPKKVIFLLYSPWIISEAVSYYPGLSFSIAWLGSFLIFYLTISSPLSYYSTDIARKEQVMRPVVLIQLIFSGFMCCTSVFYFLDHMGYEYLTNKTGQVFFADGQTEIIAKCQRLAVLGHAAMVTGIILKTKPVLPVRYKLEISGTSLLAGICLSAYMASLCLTYLPGLYQFRQPILNIAISCGAFILVHGIAKRQIPGIIFGLAAFGINLVQSVLSGFKEAIILNFILLAFLAYPFCKKIVLIFCIPCIYILLYILPTFVAVVRKQSWEQKKPKTEAGIKAYEVFFDTQNEEDIPGNNWEFLTKRFSEIGMFAAYVKQVPAQQPYYGTEILENSLTALIPRLIWPEKPDTERLAMERVYKAGVANRASSVSAKTRPVTDAYLTAGAIGVFIGMLIYGLTAQIICNKAEQLFGGYEFGCTIVFNSLFQPLWRGNTFEFLINNIVYAFILMIIIHWILCKLKLLKPDIHENNTHYTVL